jgi:cytoskeleton protein RodZ
MQPISAGRLMSEAAMSELPSDENPGDEALPGAADDVVQADEVVAQVLTVGQRLAVERESKEWTIAYVASQLNLAPRQIQALETDNYAALPGLVSVRGFIRSYAKLLKIDASPLIAMIAGEQAAPIQQLEPKRSLSTMPFSDNLLMSDDRRSSARTMLIAVVVVLLALAAVAVEWNGGWSTLSQSLSSQIQDITSASAQSAASPDVAVQSEPPASAVVPAPTADMPAAQPLAAAASVKAVATNDPVASESAPTSPVREQEQPAPHAVANHATTGNAAVGNPATAKNLLVMKVREDSWIEVRAGSNTLFSRLVKAGATESMEISEPVALTVGNAAGVDVVFRGSPLDVRSEAKSNVVRLSLK